MVSENVNIGVFGGSFDPPHFAHLYIAEETRKLYDLEFVYWLLTESNPLKKTPMYSIEQRNAMINRLTPRNGVHCPVMFTKSNKTIDYIEHLNSCGKFNIHLILGSDLKDSIKQWHRYSDLKNLVKFCWADRPGHNTNERISCPIDISSHSLRYRIENNENLYGLMSEQVINYINGIRI